MQYLLMIYSAEDSGPQPGEAEYGDYMNAYFDFTRRAREAGVFVAGEPLVKVSMATTVRVREGKAEISDGPFAETKEVLGGYYLLDCGNLDQALDWAGQIPTARHGSIEVRPIMDLPCG
ncbi:MAG: hypothetical protein ACI8P9_000743 [Parasphingorhabdus sp.]|jgi:hypothetical protein